jgi:hypothetical protein
LISRQGPRTKREGEGEAAGEPVKRRRKTEKRKGESPESERTIRPERQRVRQRRRPRHPLQPQVSRLQGRLEPQPRRGRAKRDRERPTPNGRRGRVAVATGLGHVQRGSGTRGTEEEIGRRQITAGPEPEPAGFQVSVRSGGVVRDSRLSSAGPPRTKGTITRATWWISWMLIWERRRGQRRWIPGGCRNRLGLR